MKHHGSVQRLLRVSRTVPDLETTVTFYRALLGFSLNGEVIIDDPAWGELMGIPGARGHLTVLKLGAQDLELVAFDPPHRVYPSESGATDLWFQHIAVVVSDMDAAHASLSHHSFVTITEHGPQRLPPTAGSVTAFKFRDPDGHPVELIHFPPGTGNVIWQRGQGLFRGIDHAAIDVADMQRSVDFYTRVLGLSVASRSVNSGPEQARLDHVRDVLVDVVALQPAIDGPPHVELLRYEWPTGRPIPTAVKSNDVVADRLVLQVRNLPRLMKTLEAEHIEFISPGLVTLRSGQRGAQVRDPTGHRLVLMESDSP
ncbi:MAG: VOC family protein [Acidiferrobacteraceae bacterium]